MANKFADAVTGRSLNPWVVDTPTTTWVVGNPLMIEDDVIVSTVRWVGASDAAHSAIIKDRSGNTVWESTAAAADDREESQPMSMVSQRWKGFVVTTLGSGRLYIAYE